MRIPSLKPGDAVEIKWVDANSPSPNVWITTEEAAERDPEMAIHSIGYFIGKRDGYLSIAGEKSMSDEFTDVVNRVFFIPIGCVTEVRKV